MVSEQLYRNTLNVGRFVQLRRFPEFCGLCCYIGKPVPWSPYNTIDRDPTAYDPRSRRCVIPHPTQFIAIDPWSHIPRLRPCDTQNSWIRICDHCNQNSVENEVHILFHCDLYNDLRKTQLFTNYNIHDIVCFLFNNTDSRISRLAANLIFQAFERRKKHSYILPFHYIFISLNLAVYCYFNGKHLYKTVVLKKLVDVDTA